VLEITERASRHSAQSKLLELVVERGARDPEDLRRALDVGARELEHSADVLPLHLGQGLGAQRRGKVVPRGGYFGSLQLLADIKQRFRGPPRGGRPTDHTWTERRLIPLAPRTLQRLERLAAKIRQHGNVSLEPMQLAGLLLEKSAEKLNEKEAERLLSAKEASH